MVNQASLTGESNPVRKAEGAAMPMQALLWKKARLPSGPGRSTVSNKYEKIIMTMIEESEKAEIISGGWGSTSGRPSGSVHFCRDRSCLAAYT